MGKFYYLAERALHLTPVVTGQQNIVHKEKGILKYLYGLAASFVMQTFSKAIYPAEHKLYRPAARQCTYNHAALTIIVLNGFIGRLVGLKDVGP